MAIDILMIPGSSALVEHIFFNSWWVYKRQKEQIIQQQSGERGVDEEEQKTTYKLINELSNLYRYHCSCF